MIETKLIHGDCLEKLKELPDCSVDSVVTDPPYGLSFMGKKWDYDVPSVEVWKECLRVLKPGGHLLAFAGTRTQHRMAVRIEDAGFEIRDMIAWVYGSGFPKSHNLKDEWQGWGTALKPALEPITVARKPLGEKTVAANVLTHGTGGINVDGCRVGANGGTAKGSKPQGNGNGIYGAGLHGACEITQLNAGRWPANLVHDGSDEVVGLFPMTGPARRNALSDGRSVPFMQAGGEKTGGHSGRRDPSNSHDDAGGSAARFFYCAKTNSTDRNEGCEDLPDKEWAADGAAIPERANRPFNPSKNNHPTVKPTSLMQYLCRLITQPGGIVLDPFMGSGSTGKAAVIEGFNFIGIEREESYMEIAEARINSAKTPTWKLQESQ
jgi:site-specific DNA-methyltransferase (adenine-specific)